MSINSKNKWAGIFYSTQILFVSWSSFKIRWSSYSSLFFSCYCTDRGNPTAWKSHSRSVFFKSVKMLMNHLKLLSEGRFRFTLNFQYLFLLKKKLCVVEIKNCKYLFIHQLMCIIGILGRQFIVWFLMTFSGISLLFYPPSEFISLPIPWLEPPLLSHFPHQNFCVIFPSLLFIPAQELSHFTFLVSAVTTGYVLTSKDLVLITSNERELVTFVFQTPGCFTRYGLFQFQSFTWSFHGLIFIIHSSVEWHWAVSILKLLWISKNEHDWTSTWGVRCPAL